MKHLIIKFMAITLGSIALSSCSSMEDVAIQKSVYFQSWKYWLSVALGYRQR